MLDKTWRKWTLQPFSYIYFKQNHFEFVVKTPVTQSSWNNMYKLWNCLILFWCIYVRLHTCTGRQRKNFSTWSCTNPTNFATVMAQGFRTGGLLQEDGNSHKRCRQNCVMHLHGLAFADTPPMIERRFDLRSARTCTPGNLMDILSDGVFHSAFQLLMEWSSEMKGWHLGLICFFWGSVGPSGTVVLAFEHFMQSCCEDLNDGNVLCSPDSSKTWQLDALIDWEGAAVGRDLWIYAPKRWVKVARFLPSSSIHLQLMRVSHMRTASRGKVYGPWLRLPRARGHVGRGSNTSETLVNVAGSQDQMDDGSNGRQCQLNSYWTIDWQFSRVDWSKMGHRWQLPAFSFRVSRFSAAWMIGQAGSCTLPRCSAEDVLGNGKTSEVVTKLWFVMF